MMIDLDNIPQEFVNKLNNYAVGRSKDKSYTYTRVNENALLRSNIEDLEAYDYK